ncbi:MAG: hypothetical protein GY811_17135, partial [Myxococcales bacterium]|nr:hypothetical protein [Myxococcales bacterium]
MSLSQNVQPHRAPPPIGLVASIVIAALGGFVGGMLLEHGPTYLNVHIAQPVLGQAAEPSEFVSAQAAEPALLAAPASLDEGKDAPRAFGAQSRIVVHANDAAYLVIAGSASTSLGRGNIRSSAHEGLLTTLRQKVNTDKLSADQREWIGAEVTLYDGSGYACSAIVEEVELLQQYAGDGSSLDTWDEYAGGPLLTARVTPSKGRCKAAVWGRHAGLTTPSIARIGKGTAKQRREARRAFRSSKAYRKHQKEFSAEGHTGNWHTYQEGELDIQVVSSPEQELVFVQAQVGGCGDFDVQLGTVFERVADGTL